MTEPLFNGHEGGLGMPGQGTDTTGRYLVLLQEGAEDQAVRTLQDQAGIRVARAGELKLENVSSVLGGSIDGTAGVVFEELGVALVQVAPDQMRGMRAAAAPGGAILAIEPERLVYALTDGPAVFAPRSATLETELGLPADGTRTLRGPAGVVNGDYLRGYRDAVNTLVADLLERTQAEPPVLDFAPTVDLTQATWGLQITGVVHSKCSGRGASIAVLDTGMDLNHPDFAGRPIQQRSFVGGQAVQDQHGHGTHCIGTACGPLRPARLPRYGIAYECSIYTGKVLSNEGTGSDGGILAGINWAVANGCSIVSMSLGRKITSGEPFNTVFEQAARRALARGTLIIAAAGNDSYRPSSIYPVSHPANCPSILSVGALDSQLRVAYFSNGGLYGSGGEVNIVAPGVNVYSAWIKPREYNTISGTSMATPHIAGIAALWQEATGARGRELAQRLRQSARQLPLPVRDAGWGLVQAP